ncbi:MAG: aspartate racemase [Blastocatellia bacterium]|nr:MAG: aspartate racemase [Blastocatellia bacterium]
MKVIGLIGGMSWESSAEYYRIINQTVRNVLGGQHSAKSLMYSVDFHDIEHFQHAGQWQLAAQEMISCAKRLERGGADFIVLCTNTMHKLAADIESSVSIPLLHIADATAEKIQAAKLKRVGLLGTRFTMEQDFYKGRLEQRHGIEVLVPGEKDRDIVHRVIYDELCQGKILESSKREYLQVMKSLNDAGAEGTILGCTEIGLLIRRDDSALPIFDTTRIHAEKAVELALSDNL